MERQTKVGGTELTEKLAREPYLRVGEVTCRWEEKVDEMLLCFNCLELLAVGRTEGILSLYTTRAGDSVWSRLFPNLCHNRTVC